MTETLLLALLLTAGPSVETSPSRTTRLYVRTLPAGAEVQVDGKSLGRSDGLFLVPPGVHKLTAELDDFDGQVRQVEVLDGRITRVELILPPRTAKTSTYPTSLGEAYGDPFADDNPTPIYWVGDDRVHLGYVHDTSPLQRPLVDEGVVRFQRPAESNKLLEVEVFAGPADASAPKAELVIRVLDESLNVIHWGVLQLGEGDGPARWHTVALETAVPERFFLAFAAQPKGSVVLGIDAEVSASHSYTGDPTQGVTALAEQADWMVRAVLTPPPRKAEVR